MRFILVALLAGLCVASAYYVDGNDSGKYTQRQKEIFRLFKYINQPSYYQDHMTMAENYRFWENKEAYMKPEVIEELLNYWNYGKLLPRDQIFSVFNNEHLKQAIALFKLFYYAKDYETFYRTAVWARNNVNQGMFLYSVSVALIHRPDTYYYALPPIYEIYPYYFYNAEVIKEAQYYKQLYGGQDGAQYNNKIIYANYSGYYMNLNREQSLSYFTEDVGINSYYYYYNMYYPFWMSGEEFNLKNDNRGELFYYMYQQILARYYMERLSNGLGEIDNFNWEVPFETGYYSSLCYPNGLQFPTRPNYARLHEYFYNYGQKYGFNKYAYSYTYVKDYERRIRDAIDSGFIYDKSGEKIGLFTPEGVNIMGNMMEGNPESPYMKYYGAYQVFARHLLGYSYQPLNYMKIYPSALEHFETSMRDPAFYMLYKKLITYFMKYKAQTYKYYTEKDLMYEGVNVKNVEFDRLVTYFDYFYSDITNAVYVTPEEFVQDTFKVQVAQKRLNYKPFTYKIYVDSQIDGEAVVKVFLGPKYDEYGRYMNLTENWMNFVQFDHFVYKLKSGENVITRNSRQMYNYMHDRTSYYQIYKKAFGVYDEEKEEYMKENQFMFGFPQRYMLPKGSYNGMPYQFYVIIYKQVPFKTQKTDTPMVRTSMVGTPMVGAPMVGTPMVGTPMMGTPMVGTGSQYVDGYPMGYPFDRPVYWEQMFYMIPNAYFYETKIYFKDSETVNYGQGEDYTYAQKYMSVKQKNYSKQEYYPKQMPQYYNQQPNYDQHYNTKQPMYQQAYNSRPINDQQYYNTKEPMYQQRYNSRPAYDQEYYSKQPGYGPFGDLFYGY